MKKTIINETRFLQRVAPFLFKKSDIAPEMIENAVRAGAKKITFHVKGKIFNIKNDGAVLEDLTKLFVIADSSYGEGIEESHKPAGMGILSIISASEKVKFISGNQMLTIDSEKYFNDSNYRLSLFDSILHFDEYVDGLEIYSTLKEPFERDTLCYHMYLFKYYNIDIEINGEKQLSKEEYDFFLKKEYEKGVTVGIKKDRHGIKEGLVIWHGKIIKVQKLYPYVIVVNAKTDLVTPQLPDRSGLVCEDFNLLKIKLETFLKDEIQQKLNGLDDTKYCNYMLNSLTESYNIDHFTTYSSIEESGNKVLINSNVKYRIFHNEKELENVLDLEIHDSEFAMVSDSIGATKAPSWVLNRLCNECDIRFQISEKAAKAAGFTQYRDDKFNICDSLTINGTPCSGVVFTDDFEYDILYFTKDIDCDDFAYEKRESYNWENQSYEETQSEILEDLNEIIGAYEDEVKIDLKYTLCNAFCYVKNKYNLENIDSIDNVEMKKIDGNWVAIIKVDDENTEEFEVIF
ncbi:MAG: hypothetical protein ACPGUI_00490 [Halarcobacter sp.]